MVCKQEFNCPEVGVFKQCNQVLQRSYTCSIYIVLFFSVAMMLFNIESIYFFFPFSVSSCIISQKIKTPQTRSQQSFLLCFHLYNCHFELKYKITVKDGFPLVLLPFANLDNVVSVIAFLFLSYLCSWFANKKVTMRKKNDLNIVLLILLCIEI